MEGKDHIADPNLTPPVGIEGNTAHQEVAPVLSIGKGTARCIARRNRSL